MGKNLQKVYGIRTDDEIMEKFTIIAQKHCRTRNKEIEYALKEYIKSYERNEGTININKVNNIQVNTINNTINT